MVKIYSVSLEEIEVKRAKNYCHEYGGKLSPLINQLLKEWNDRQEQSIKEGDSNG